MTYLLYFLWSTKDYYDHNLKIQASILALLLETKLKCEMKFNFQVTDILTEIYLNWKEYFRSNP